MAFREAMRQFWMDVTGGKCAVETYSEQAGFQECGLPAAHVHHIEPEGWQLVHGLDAEHSIGMPVCKSHHVGVGNGENLPFTEGFSFHPDMGQAYRDYKAFREQQANVAHTIGWRAATEMKSPFQETSQQHREMAENGERYWSGTEESDQYYIEKMQVLEMRYLAEHPEIEYPQSKPHPHIQEKPKWWEEI